VEKLCSVCPFEMCGCKGDGVFDILRYGSAKSCVLFITLKHWSAKVV